MYLPKHFEETRAEVLQALMRSHPLATLVTTGAAGLQAEHLPLEFDAAAGLLRGHVARANPVWREADTATAALAIFQGPQHYVSPSWYPSKQADGRVVPTWNYIVVHARGELRFVEDHDWLRALVGRLTDRHEAASAQPWQLSDAPEEFIERQLGAIVGVELRISALQGKWKLSQNRPAADRAGVVAGLQQQEGEAAAAMAAQVLGAMER
ncbi:MAG TPA: FMN-binding negative transcriptional regulator [Solimonas sp.]|nr:FMN-binding negative transcriptional regulator [Solimonas sp.]